MGRLKMSDIPKEILPEGKARCVKCGGIFDIKDMNTKNVCFDCYNKRQREYRKENAEKMRSYDDKRKNDPKRKVWKEEYKSTPQQKRKHADVEKERRKRLPEAQLLSRAKTRSKKRGLEFNITIDDIIIPEFCPVLGLKLEVNDACVGDTSMSLDRIDPKKGYIKGNIMVISNRANKIKNDSTVDELGIIYNFYKNLMPCELVW